MGNRGSSDSKVDPAQEKHSAHGKYEGVVPKRHSTDCLFFLLILAMWVAMTVVGARAIVYGNPYRLVSPIDDRGYLCGNSPSVSDKPYFYTVLTKGVGVCVDKCPNVTAPDFTSTSPDDYICLDSVYAAVGTGVGVTTYISTNCRSGGNFDIESNCGCMIKLNSKSVLHRCRLTDKQYANKFQAQKLINYVTGFVADIYDVKGVVFGIGIGVAVLLSLIFVIFLRSQILTSIFIWGTMVGVLAMLIVLTAVAYNTASMWKHAVPQTHTDNEILGLRASSIVFVVLAGVWFIIMLWERKNIQIAIKLMSLTAECIEDMPLVLLTPLVETISIVIFLVPWFIYVIFIASEGEFKTVQSSSGLFSYVTYSLDKGYQEKLWFLFFCYLWTTEFIIAVGTIVISIAVANWYFSTPDQRTLNGGCRDLSLGWYHALRYHMGTAAFGSLVIAIISFIRAVILYIERQMKKYANNFLIKFVFCCINCCVWCVEQCLRFIANHAYIQTAIHGFGFCTAAKDAFFLIVRNCLRVGILTTLSNLALFIAKVIIVFICGGTTYFVLTRYYQDELNGLIAPTVLSMFLAFAVVGTFTSVFRAVVDTMLQAYCTDEEQNDGNPKYIKAAFKKFVDDHALTQDEYDEYHGNKKSDKNKDTKAVAATNGVNVASSGLA